ncbi:hypothetical protein HanRHA438_Chr15g0713871 [Helianthus annuus]|nr:hypothetical protein HanIR_Chr15g0762971 [Helianthus annuus]KAJ0845456.1 hypothetical protein HanRHA438_Chr15g0713871 [Helianthus annuus]
MLKAAMPRYLLLSIVMCLLFYLKSYHNSQMSSSSSYSVNPTNSKAKVGTEEGKI